MGHEPTRHLPPALALPQVWYPDCCIPFFTLHCKTSPVNKQMPLCIFGEAALPVEDGQQPSMAVCRAESPAGSRLKGRPCCSLAQPPVARQGQGSKGSGVVVSWPQKTPSPPQQTRFLMGGAISALRSPVPA